MNLGDYLIWEATNGPLLIRVVIGLVMLARRLRGQPVFSERDWLFSLWSFTEKSFVAAVGAEIRGALASADGRWPRYRVLRLTLWPRMVRGRCTSHHSGHFAYCAEMAGMKVHKYAAQKKKPFTDDYLRRLDSGFHRRTDDTAD